MRMYKQFHLALFAIALLFSPLASADETLPGLPSEATIDRTVNTYAREDKRLTVMHELQISEIDICQQEGVTCLNLQADPLEAMVECDGSASTLDDGGWKKLSDAGKCWNSLTVCYNYGQPNETCYVVDEHYTQNDLPGIQASFTPYASENSFSICDPNALSKSSDKAYKEYCLWAYTGDSTKTSGTSYAEKRTAGSVTSGGGTLAMTGDTGDDMLKITKETSGFIEYLDIGQNDVDGLKWVSRGSDAASSNDMMIPMGPRETYRDYRNFLSNPPPGVSVKNACYPVNMRLGCESWRLNMCGSYALKNFLFKPRDNADQTGLCAEGTPSQVTLDSAGGLSYSWTCMK